MTQPTPPIDFVLPWVDSTDPAWQADYLAHCHADAPDAASAAAERFRDWDLLRYWFRGVEMFAPWVHTVHLITCGHYPAWLRLDHPKIHLVKHVDYIAPAFLPTFSSHVLELCLKNISGLAEHFVYFNDDTFLIKPVSPDFFFADGLPKDCLYLDFITPCNSFSYFQFNDLCLINRHFDKQQLFRQQPKLFFNHRYLHRNSAKALLKNLFLLTGHSYPGFKNTHLPQPFLKSVHQTVWQHEAAALAATLHHRFRRRSDLNQYVFRYWQLAAGLFSPDNVFGKGHYYGISEATLPQLEMLAAQPYAMVCLNDTENTGDFAALKTRLHHIMDKILPEPSSFER